MRSIAVARYAALTRQTPQRHFLAKARIERQNLAAFMPRSQAICGIC